MYSSHIKSGFCQQYSKAKNGTPLFKVTARIVMIITAVTSVTADEIRKNFGVNFNSSTEITENLLTAFNPKIDHATAVKAVTTAKTELKAANPKIK